MTEKILKPFVLPNLRGGKEHCEICFQKFQLLLKQEHQCKRCLRSICQKCGPKRLLTYMIQGNSSLHRNCIACIKQVQNIEYYQSSYKLCFGQDSSFVQQWLKKLNKQRKTNTEIMNQYIQMANISVENTIRFKKQSDQIFNELLPSYNFSFRHFIRSLTKTLNLQKVNQKIKSVMLAVYGYSKNLPYIPELIYLVVFILCFSSEYSAYYLVSRLIEKVYPQYVRVRKMKKDNLLANELKVILELYKILAPKADEDQLSTVATYLEVRFSQYLVSFTLNIPSITNSFIVLQELFKTANYLSLYQGITAMIYCCRQSIASFKSPTQIQIELLKEVTIQILRNAILKFQRSQVKLELSHEVFDSAQHRKLHQKYIQIQALFKRSKQINLEKSKQIQSQKQKIHEQKKIINELNLKIQKYQEEILYFSLQIPQIQELDNVRNQNSRLTRLNEQKQLQAQKYKNLYREMEKERYVKNHDHEMLKHLYEDYSKQIIQLRSYTQILEIKIAAKNIDFDTSIIDQKLQQKNNKIEELTQKCRSLNTQMEFYKSKNFNSLIKKQPTQQKQINVLQKQQMAASFKKKLQSSIQLTTSLKTKIQNLQADLNSSQQRVKQLQEQYKKDFQIIQKNKKVELIMNQISEEYEYEVCVSDLERFVLKETNFAKKSIVQTCLKTFKKTISQLRFKEIDIRMKQDKIAQILQKQHVNSHRDSSGKSSIRQLTNGQQQQARKSNNTSSDHKQEQLQDKKIMHHPDVIKEDDTISRKFTNFNDSEIQDSEVQFKDEKTTDLQKIMSKNKNGECIIM